MPKKKPKGASTTIGRPLLDIDPTEVKKLAAIGCKTSEIADWFGCSTDTIENRFSAELLKGRANVRLSLRRFQLQAAEQLNPTLLIWLGKQMLGQTDQHDISLSVRERPLKDLTDEELADLRAKTLSAPDEG